MSRLFNIKNKYTIITLSILALTGLAFLKYKHDSLSTVAATYTSAVDKQKELNEAVSSNEKKLKIKTESAKKELSSLSTDLFFSSAYADNFGTNWINMVDIPVSYTISSIDTDAQCAYFNQLATGTSGTIKGYAINAPQGVQCDYSSLLNKYLIVINATNTDIPLASLKADFAGIFNASDFNVMSFNSNGVVQYTPITSNEGSNYCTVSSLESFTASSPSYFQTSTGKQVTTSTTVTNNSPVSTLTIDNFSFNDSAANVYSVTSSCSNVKPNGSCTLSITSTPTISGNIAQQIPVTGKLSSGLSYTGSFYLSGLINLDVSSLALYPTTIKASSVVEVGNPLIWDNYVTTFTAKNTIGKKIYLSGYSDFLTVSNINYNGHRISPFAVARTETGSLLPFESNAKVWNPGETIFVAIGLYGKYDASLTGVYDSNFTVALDRDGELPTVKVSLKTKNFGGKTISGVVGSPITVPITNSIVFDGSLAQLNTYEHLGLSSINMYLESNTAEDKYGAWGQSPFIPGASSSDYILDRNTCAGVNNLKTLAPGESCNLIITPLSTSIDGMSLAYYYWMYFYKSDSVLIGDGGSSADKFMSFSITQP